MCILVLNYEYPPLGGGAGVATAALPQGSIEGGIAVDVVTSSVSQLNQDRVWVRAILTAAADRELVPEQARSALRSDVAPFLDADVEFVDRLPTGPRAKFRVVEALAG
ncbi:MAG TPA: hypothetical protein VHH32_02965 [Gemmatimonadales bacterium]|nr:hypothetical protein [Gemmatimonadales bacterium]